LVGQRLLILHQGRNPLVKLPEGVLRKKTFHGGIGNRVRLPAGLLQLGFGEKGTGRRVVHKIAGLTIS
jgi:hypothetical protein